jgi:uncharacterized protein (DUF1501 family)
MGVGAGVVAGTGGSLLDELLLGHDPSAWAAGPIGPTDGILVVIGMFGGNDGLNTVVPFGNGHYYDMHGSLAIPAANTLQIAPNRGLHPELTELKRFWDDGELAIVEGVGYPDPDLSHFNSMAFWMAGRPHVIPTSGWLGRWLDGHLAGSKDLYTAAEIGHSVPLHMIGTEQRATVVPPNRPGYGADQSPRYQRQYEAIREMRDGAADGWAELVGDAFVDQLDLAKTLAPVFPAEGSLPDDELTAQLEVAARLINANLGFRVLTAGYGDFDSHAGQPQQHPVRMSELNVAVRRFFEVLEPVWGSRVTVMTFSEFGRTPWDNDGLGTDHGTSAPHFVFGKNVRGGFYGQHPSLAGLGRWDRLEHHVDFRSYYASIIDGWLGGGSSDVLGGEFENLGLFANAPGYSGGGIVPGPASPTPPSRIVPVAPVRVVDTRRGLGAPRRPIGPGQTIRAKVTGVAGLPASGVTAVIANVTAVAPTSRMHFKVFPGGTASPATSNLNSTPARNVPNLVAMAVSPDGHIEVMNSDGDTHCLVDVLGYATTEDEGAGFVPVMPQRLFDTRRGVGVRSGPLPSGSAVEIQVAGRAGVPIGGATAVIVNLAAVDPASQGKLRVQPSGSPRVGTSNVNYRPGETAPNLVLCKIGPSGSILVEASSACHAIGDVFGFVASGGDLLVATPPRRVLDTRRGLGAPQATVGPERHIDLAVTGVSGVPETATAVVLNVTATNVAAKSHVRVWPAGSGEPTTSNLNLASGVTRANLVVCQVGENGIVSLWNPIAECDLIADVFGYFAPDGETLV